MKRLVIVAVAIVLGGLAAWCILPKGLNAPFEVPFETIEKTGGKIDFDIELDKLALGMSSLGSQLPQEALIAGDMARECQSIKTLLKESFGSPPYGAIDVILFAHRDPFNKIDFRKKGIDPAKSLELVSGLLEKNQYDIVEVEGSAYDGFSTETTYRELFARLRYARQSPLAKQLTASGIDLGSYDAVKTALGQAQLHGTVADQWSAVEKKAGRTSFLAGESLPLMVIEGKFVSGEIASTHSKEILKELGKLRSAYVLAKTIRDMRERHCKSAAIVFGYLHEDDFKQMAQIGIKARIYNATGVDRERLRNVL